MTFLLGPDRDGKQLVTDGDRVRSYGPSIVDDAPITALDCRGCHLEPGRINAHTHIYSGLAPFDMPPPAVPPENFLQILQRVWWRLDRALDEASLRAAARYYAAEALLAGTTTLIDHHESPNLIEGSLDILADACQEVGIRALLCYGATERNEGRREAHRGLAECARFLRENDRPLITGAVALHASFTVSDDTILEAGELCRTLGTVLHVHVSEDLADVVDASERGFAGPLERLLELGALPAGSILAHCVHCGAGQVRAAADRALWIVQNPRSNRGNGVGYPGALGSSDRVAIGTDGYPADMAAEAAALMAEAEAYGEDPGRIGRRLEGGHRLAGERFGCELAPLASGCTADVVAVEDHSVKHVLVDGELVVEDRRLARADIEEIRAHARKQAPRLWARMEQL
jgi:cytosine/adenosine deaminase-related metal-dependent hydrolase